MKLADYLFHSEPGITLYCGDCRDVLPLLEPVDLLLTDPPYGIALDTNNSRFSGGTAGNMAKRGNGIGSARAHRAAGQCSYCRARCCPGSRCYCRRHLLAHRLSNRRWRGKA